jgi:hypothetical protein
MPKKSFRLSILFTDLFLREINPGSLNVLPNLGATIYPSGIGVAG